MPNDWNNGCTGKSNAGSRYYKYSTSMESIIKRMLMYGFVEEGSCDITAGDVYGLWYEIGEDGSEVWHKSLDSTAWRFEEKENFDFYHK